ncbi:MAG: hypothetical protein KAV99_01905, partial [Candidatus Latescibacteria bacterium]|nr:hypothetical protein [Candidatus Latescibacterota bacterium]
VIESRNDSVKVFMKRNTRFPQQVLLSLKQVWKEYELPDRKFSDFESSLVRLGKTYCRRGRCTECLMKNLCPKVRC